jgi:hypothetical protein
MRHFVKRQVRARAALSMLIGAVLVTVVLAGTLVSQASALPSCTDTFTGATGGLWSTAANWSGGVPTSASVACWSPGTMVAVSSGATADSVQGGNLSLTGGSLALASSANGSTIVDLSIGAGSSLNGPGALAVTGNFAWTGGAISSASPIAITQTGTGTLSISGSSQAYLHGGAISTAGNVSISNPNFIAAASNGSPTLTTAGTVTFAPGAYSANGGFLLPISAIGFIATGATTLGGYSLHLTGNSSSLGADLSTPGLTVDSGKALTVPAGVDLAATSSATISGTVTGAGIFTQNGGTTTVAAGGTLSTDHTAVSAGTLTVAATAGYSAATATTVGGGTLAMGPSGATTGDLTVATGGALNGPGALAVTGNFAWTGGDISPATPIAITQTGAGSFGITGTSQARILGGSVTTASDVTITNTSFISAGSPTLTTTGTVSFAAGSYQANGGAALTISAHGFVTPAATATLTNYGLHLTGSTSSLAGNLVAPKLDTAAGTTLTIPAGVVLSSAGGTISGTVTGHGTYTQNGGTTTVASTGTLSTDSVTAIAGTLTVDSAATYSTAAGTAVGGGTLNIGPSAAQTGDLTVATTNSNLNGPGALSVAGNISWTGGQISPNSSLAITQTGSGSFGITGAGLTYLKGGSITTAANVTISDPAFLTAAPRDTPTITTSGTLDLAPGLDIPANGGNTATFTAAGVGANPGPTYGVGSDTLVLTGATTTVAGGNTLQSGSLLIEGGTVQDDGTLDPGSTTLTGGTLTGTGTVASSVTNTGATVAPGDGTGTLSVSGDYTQGAGGSLAVTVNGTGAGQFSALSVSGDVSVNGRLALLPSPAYAAAATTGDTVPILQFPSGAGTGTFATTTVNPRLQASEPFSADYAPGHVITAVVGAGVPPLSTGPPAIQGTVVEGETLSGTTGAWDNDPTSFAYEWESCDGTGADCTVIAGATSSVHVLTTADVGSTIRMIVTATNAGGSTPAASNRTSIVLPPPPSAATAPVISGTPTLGGTLTCAAGSWSQSPTTFRYQWSRDGEPINDATQATYTVQAPDRGHSLACTVTASNAGGDGTPRTSAAVPLAPAPPASLTAPSIKGNPIPDHNLTCSRGTWTGSPSAFSYQWYRGNTAIPGATAPVYAVQILDEAQTLNCSVTATNPGGATTATASLGLLVAVKGTLTCPEPGGRISGATLGPLSLSMTRTRARHILKRFAITTNHFDNFCLYGGWGVRVAYPSARLLRSMPPSRRRQLTGTIVLALTANPYYNLGGARPGTPMSQVSRRRQLGRPLHVGTNTWYIAPGGAGSRVFKVRHGIIQEIGIANPTLTAGRKAQSEFLRSFNAG